MATKNLTPLAMIARLMTVYQPGHSEGFGEKKSRRGGSSITRSKCFGERVQRLVRKVLEANKELGFRISLTKTTLMVECVPREETVHKLAEHLVAD